MRNEQEFPRAWIVHRVRAVERPVGLSRASRSAAIEEMLYANDRFWLDHTKVSFDPHQLAWVASDDIPEVSPKLSDRPPTNSENVAVTYPSPQQAVLEADLESPGLVVLADVFYPGWQLTIDDKPAKIYQVNQLMRGALVPAGHHRLVYTFCAAIVPDRPGSLGARACCACSASASSAKLDPLTPCSQVPRCPIHRPTKPPSSLHRTT